MIPDFKILAGAFAPLEFGILSLIQVDGVDKVDEVDRVDELHKGVYGLFVHLVYPTPVHAINAKLQNPEGVLEFGILACLFICATTIPEGCQVISPG